MTYLDYNATTPLQPAAFEAMRAFMLDFWGNPSSPHVFGESPRCAIDESRRSLADLIGASPGEVIFTSGATESNQTVLHSFSVQGKGVVTTAVEHSSILSATESLRGTAPCVLVPVSDQGVVDLVQLQQALSGEEAKGVVSAIWVNNETGVVAPVREIAQIAHSAGWAVHFDAAQALGKMPVDVNAIPADFVSLSAHKIYGPKGIGALFIRKGTSFVPFLKGTQERQRRGGTEAVPLIVGFGVAAKSAQEAIHERMEGAQRLRDSFEEQLMQVFPGAAINGSGVSRVGNTSSITFPDVDAEVLVSLLSEKGVMVSNGSACKSSAPTPSHVLLAMGRSYDEANGTLRVSFSHLNDDQDVATILRALEESVPLLSAS